MSSPRQSARPLKALPPRVRVVLFDAVGTLIYSDPSVVDTYERAGKRHGSHVSRAEIRLRFRASLKRHAVSGPTDDCVERERWQAIVSDVFDDVDVGAGLFTELWDHFGEPQHWRLFDDVAETIVRLEGRGITVGIASNFDERLLQVRDGHETLLRLETVFYSARVGYTKPHGEFFARVTDHLDAAPNEILLVGDDPLHDIVGATNAGWHALQVDRSRPPVPGRLADLRELVWHDA